MVKPYTNHMASVNITLRVYLVNYLQRDIKRCRILVMAIVNIE